MVESVDTRDLKSLGVRAVRVQVPLRVPWEKKNKINDKQCRETTERWFFCVCFSAPILLPNSSEAIYIACENIRSVIASGILK